MVTNRFTDYEYDDTDKYDAYEDEINRAQDRQARKKRKPKAAPPNWQVRDKKVEEVIDPAAIEGKFKTTYVPSKHEAGWLMGSLNTFFEEHVITDVLAVVKGGKEASVYRCEADPSTGAALLAAKVYRPQMFRSLSNDTMYKQGRAVLTADAHQVHTNMTRVVRAIGKKTAYGREVSHTSWLMHEFTTMQQLHEAGAAVPKPYAVAENAIIMTYLGDEALAAPPLSEVRLDRDEAHELFDEVMRNIRLMLDHGVAHGDLSAYNILYWDGAITLIDFPQVVSMESNTDAHFILKRDVTRVCEYFTRQGVACDARRITAELWDRYGEAQRRRVWEMSFDDEGNWIG